MNKIVILGKLPTFYEFNDNCMTLNSLLSKLILYNAVGKCKFEKVSDNYIRVVKDRKVQRWFCNGQLWSLY